MINKIKFSDQFNSNCLKLNNVLLGVNYGISYGPTNITNFWAGVTPPENGYTIYISPRNTLNGEIFFNSSYIYLCFR